MSDHVLDSVSDGVGPAETGAWLPLAVAARQLGVTVRTLDRRKLPKRRRPGRPTEVWVAGAVSETVSAPSETSDGHVSDDAERALVLSERVSDLVGRQLAPVLVELTACRERIEALARENGELRATVAAQDARIATLDVSTSMAASEPSRQPSRLWGRSWAVYGGIGLLAVVVPILAWVLLGLSR